MALAFLCSQIRQIDPDFPIGDNPVGGFLGITVDHGLRKGSDSEAQAVRTILRHEMGLSAYVVPLSSNKLRTAPNMESMARRLRYRAMGDLLAGRRIESLLLAHHEDDQYETVLMRLLSGHGSRGLRGMRAATDIPECQDMHRVYQSGFIDDQLRGRSLFTTIPGWRERRKMMKQLRIEALDLNDEDQPDTLSASLTDMVQRSAAVEAVDRIAKPKPWSPPLETEDAGITIYRPLLGFSKERLIATCVENGVKWFEDHTNEDPTLTMRNALRHAHKYHHFPVALQKPAVLAMSRRCDTRAMAEDRVATGLLARVRAPLLDTRAGTLLVQLPELRVELRRRFPRRHSALRETRRDHMRRLAAVLVQRLLMQVTPESQVTPITNLQTVVDKLFPQLAAGYLSEAAIQPPKAFNICGVHLQPTRSKEDDALLWYLSRQPYPSQLAPPSQTVTARTFHSRWLAAPSNNWPWAFEQQYYPCSWELYDGRFWIRVNNRLPYDVIVQPFEAIYAREFRESLDEASREELAGLLKMYAPGKVRYTLPAIYTADRIDWALKNECYWPKELFWNRDGSPRNISEDERRLEAIRWEQAPRHAWTGERRNKSDTLLSEQRAPEEAPPEERSMRLLALPTIDVALPGLRDWLRWECRYRKVDWPLLSGAAQDMTTAP